MIRDISELENGATIRTRLCIIGGGAAGITLAHELVGAPFDVCVLESGGLLPEASTQALYEGEIVGLPGPALHVSRLRSFGGGTGHWGGVVRPLDPIDFEARDYVPYSGWPFGYDELEPYYVRAQSMCDAGPWDYEIRHWESGEHRLYAFAGRLEHTMWQRSRPVNFGVKYRNALAQAGNVTVFLHANATSLQTAAGGQQVQRVRVATLAGSTYTVEAPLFVLACGGLENTRLLLASPGPGGRGVANGQGLVGRFYAGHPRIDGTARALLLDDAEHPSLYEEFLGAPSAYPVTAFLAVGEAQQREERLLNTAFRLYFQPADDRMEDAPFAPPAGRSADVQREVSALLSALGRRGRSPEAQITLRSRTEVVPNPDSRVVLGKDLDALGMPRLKVDWRLTAADHASLARCTTIVAEEFGRLGLGRVRLADWLGTPFETAPSGFFGSWHHMGTTRMCDNPRAGVVNRDGRCHEVGNLYIAGSSVFPTYGWGTPTLTIVALALRLAGQLRAEAASIS